MNHFSDRFGKKVVVNNTTWRYYRLGVGAPILWLPGGVRRAAFGFAFLERLAVRHTVISPDYPPVQTNEEFIAAFDAILQAEGVDTFALGGQSYGGGLAQVYLAHKVKSVERLILSSTAPGNYSKALLPAVYACMALARLLPEKTVKSLLAGGLVKAISVPEAERAEWREAINALMQNDLSRADVVSHFAVALVVPDLRSAEHYYQSVFDMELIGREAELSDGLWYTLPFDKGWEEAEAAGIELGMLALRKDEFVLALFRGDAPPGQIYAIGLSMPTEEMARVQARLPEDTQVSEDAPDRLEFRDPYQIMWQISVPGDEFRTAEDFANRWLKL